MAHLIGVYGDYNCDFATATEPTYLKIEGTEQEIKDTLHAQLGKREGVAYFFGYPPDKPAPWWTMTARADRALVREVAKLVELACDEPRISDWMARDEEEPHP